jgi:hypothetical protein
VHPLFHTRVLASRVVTAAARRMARQVGRWAVLRDLVPWPLSPACHELHSNLPSKTFECLA